MKMALVAFVITSAVWLSAQTPARDTVGTAAPTGNASLAGVIIDEAKQPVRRASVSISGMRFNRATVTDNEGRFAFATLPPGRFTVTASKPGYPSMSYGAKRPNRAGSGILVTEDQHINNISLTLARGVVLSGTVFDEHGLPMPGVPVMAWEIRTALSGERTVDFPSTGGEWVTTDDRGSYRVDGLPPGEYTVGTSWAYSGMPAAVRVPTDSEIRAAFEAVKTPATSAPAQAPATTPAVNFNYARVYYPDALDPLLATTIHMAAGEERDGLDIRMQFQPMSRIEGVVVGPDGAAVRAGLRLSRRNGPQSTRTTSVWSNDPNGQFKTQNLAPGDYTIVAQTRGTGADAALWAMEDVTISGAEPYRATLTLQPAMSIAGRVIFEGKTLSPPSDLSRFTLRLFPLERATDMNGVTPVVQPDGTFAIHGIMPGQFVFQAGISGPATPGVAGWTVRSILADGQDVTDIPLEIGAGGAPSLVITFTDQSAELSGQVTTASGQPAPDYFVIVIPADQRAWTPVSRRIRSTRPDLNGRFVFRGLPAGDYRVAVTTDLVPNDLQEASSIAGLVAQSAPVTLALGETKTFDVKLATTP